MFNRIFGKPKQEANALTTLDKLNEVSRIRLLVNMTVSLSLISEIIRFFFFFFFCSAIIIFDALFIFDQYVHFS